MRVSRIRRRIIGRFGQRQQRGVRRGTFFGSFRHLPWLWLAASLIGSASTTTSLVTGFVGPYSEQIRVIGEAAKRVSLGFQSAHPEIPWALIVGQRNILAHEYGEVRNERIWEAATIHVPALIESLEPLAPRNAREGAEE